MIELEPTGPHLTYLILPGFLITWALFSDFVRNRLHVSEPPLAVIFGIIFGPYALHAFTPIEWGLDDKVMQEVTRIVVGVQCFTVGVGLPKLWFSRHWRSVIMLLVPVMTYSWAISSLFAYAIFQTTVPTAMIIGACLSPTDPVLAASVLGESQFSGRVPKRLRHLLSAESGCNDGIAFPFLYIGIVIFTQTSPGQSVKEFFITTIIWQCMFGITAGLIIGMFFNRVLRFSEKRGYIARPSFVAFYLLLAILSIGVGSTLGSDDFLVAFGAGAGFARDGWFAHKTSESRFPIISDLIINSGMFIYFGSVIPFSDFVPSAITPHVGIWQLFLFLALVILFRRIPIVMALYRWIPDVSTWREALFCGHFGPMGVGALFLAMESRAQIERGKPEPLPHPPVPKEPFDDKERALAMVWPVICFVVLGSTIIHGLSVMAISFGVHWGRHSHERAPLLGGETETLEGMEHDGSVDSEPEVSDVED